MRDISLHILDLVENSIRAGAGMVRVCIQAETSADVLRIIIADDGCGLRVTPAEALDPFYTTKGGKKTGLGLSLFKAACERAGGRLELAHAQPSGLVIQATMKLHHLDRSPMGDLGATVCTIVCANPALDLQVELMRNGQRFSVSSCEVAQSLACPPGGTCEAMDVARKMREKMMGELPHWADRPVMI